MVLQFIWIAVAAGPAGAAPKLPEEAPRLRILEAFVNQPLGGVLTIFGEGFPTAANVQAVVCCLGEDGAPLPHRIVDATEIRQGVAQVCVSQMEAASGGSCGAP